MKLPNIPRSSCTLQQTPSSSQFHQTEVEAQVTDVAFLVLPQPMALTGCVHRSSFQKVALGGDHVQPKNTKMDVMCWECLTQAMDLPALVSSDVSFPSLDIIHLSSEAKHDVLSFFSSIKKIKRAFSEHERHIVSFINFKPTILQNIVCCCTNHSPYQPNNLITLAPDLSLDLDLNESMGSIFPICSGNY